MEAPPHLSSHLSSLGRNRGCSRWLSPLMAAIPFNSLPCNGTVGTRAQYGLVSMTVSRLKQLKPAYLPVSAPGRRRERALVGGNNLGKAERGAAGNQGLSGQFLGERPPPRALSSQTALTRRVLAPATPDTRTKERCQFLNLNLNLKNVIMQTFGNENVSPVSDRYTSTV